MHPATKMIRALFFAAVALCNIKVHAVDIIIDNTSAQLTGTWTVSTTKPNGYNTSYLNHASGGTGVNLVTYSASIPTAGDYDVYYWLPNGASDRATNAHFTVWHSGTATTYTVNEQPTGGSWIKLGTHNFTTSTIANGIVTVSDQGNNLYVIADAVRFVTTAPSNYTVRLDVPKQTIWGLGVEIQSDSLGTSGLPDETTSVPHDLTADERTRLGTDLIGRGNGFRYIRLALGLYLRGLTPDTKNIVGRWSTQMSELASLVANSGVEGVDAEYWSPAPYWKTNRQYVGNVAASSPNSFDPSNSLRAFGPNFSTDSDYHGNTTQFLSDFSDSVVTDLSYLEMNGIPVKMFGLQNEPPQSVTSYSTCQYGNDADYVSTFNAVAAKVRASFPTAHIHVNSWAGQKNDTIRNGVNLSYVDEWTWHKIGHDSNEQIDSQLNFNTNTLGKPIYNNEFEYFDNLVDDKRCVNTAQSIMNWMCFEDSPTWFWLHALKPTTNAPAGYALGYWRPDSDNDFSKFPAIAKGHFDYELRNWRAIVGFLEKMPWDSLRYQVDEITVRHDQRIMAFRQGGPAGKLVVILTNRGSSNFTFDINSQLSGATFRGYRYSPSDYAVDLGTKTGGTINVTVPSMKIEFWIQQ